jgi:hypothetical protein
MVSLVDIGPAVDTVEVRGKVVEVNGLTASHIVGVLYSFPEVRKILAAQEADLGVIIAQAPLAIGRLIAAGTGKPDDAETIAVANGLGVGEQYEILTKVFGLTFPKGLESFLDGVGGALKQLGVPGWEAAMRSPVLSSSASPTDAANGNAGTAPPSNSEHGSNSSPDKPSSETQS